MVIALQSLLDVQRIDSKITALEKERSVFPKKLDDLKTRVAVAQKAATSLEGQTGDKDREKRALETNLSLDLAKTKKWEARLNEIRNQREYLALSRETEGQKKQNNDSSEAITRLNAEHAQLSTLLEAARDTLAEAEIDFEHERGEIERKIAEFDVQIAELSKEKAEYASQVPGPLLKRYDTIRQKRMGIALSAAEKGRCSICNISLPPQMYILVQRGETIEACPACNRLLYWREPVADTAST